MLHCQVLLELTDILKEFLVSALFIRKRVPKLIDCLVGGVVVSELLLKILILMTEFVELSSFCRILSAEVVILIFEFVNLIFAEFILLFELPVLFLDVINDGSHLQD